MTHVRTPISPHSTRNKIGRIYDTAPNCDVLTLTPTVTLNEVSSHLCWCNSPVNFHRMMNEDAEGMWTVMIVVYFKIQSWNSIAGP